MSKAWVWLIVSLQVVYHFGEFGLVMRRLILVNNIFLGQFIQHGSHFLQQRFRFLLIGGLLQSLYKSPGSLSLITVYQTLGLTGAYALQS